MEREVHSTTRGAATAVTARRGHQRLHERRAASRRAVRRLSPSTTPSAHLAPGAERTLAFDLLDYFDLPVGSAVTVWTSVRIPGVHGDIPQLGGGSGVNVRR